MNYLQLINSVVVDGVLHTDKLEALLTIEQRREVIKSRIKAGMPFLAALIDSTFNYEYLKAKGYKYSYRTQSGIKLISNWESYYSHNVAKKHRKAIATMQVIGSTHPIDRIQEYAASNELEATQIGNNSNHILVLHSFDGDTIITFRLISTIQKRLYKLLDTSKKQVAVC